MKKLFFFVSKCLPHLILILSLMLLIFFILDRINPSMAFLSAAASKSLLAVLCIVSIFHSLLCIFSKEN